MNHVIELIDIELSMQRLSSLDFYLQSSVIQIVLVSVHELLLLVKLVSSFRVNVKLQFMTHPCHIFLFVLDIFELTCETV